MPTTAYDSPTAYLEPTPSGPPQRIWPFLANRDRITTLATYPYRQRAATYQPGAIGYETDPADPLAYLTAETDLTPSGPGLVRFARTYARIPTPQIIPTTRLFERPNLHGAKSGSTYAVSFDDGATSWIFSSRLSISAIATLDRATKTVTGTTSGSGTVTGTGTVGDSGSATTPAINRQELSAADAVTITGAVGSQTIYGNDSVATILTKVQNSIAGGLGASSINRSRTDYEINIVIDSTPKFYSAETSTAGTRADLINPQTLRIYRGDDSGVGATSNTATRSTLDTRGTTDTANLTETYYPAASTRRFTTSTSHSATAGDYCALFQGDRIVATSIVIATPTATTVDLLLKDVDGEDFAAATIVFSSGADYRIQNGPIRCSARRTQTFHLPGITIDTYDEIPIPTTYTTADAWLGQAAAYLASPSTTTYAATEVSDLTPWQGPILMQEVIALQLADALVTLTP
jgi:hypothetical protein